MEIHFPAYYHSFQCLAGACPDSCCKEWTVDVDEQSADYYRQLPGALGDRLRQMLTDTPGGTVMTIENGRCPMWRDDGLCRIQAELGHDALCKTCREFPRLNHDYGDFVELGLELSCPEAARLILSSEGGMLVQTQPGGAEPDYEPEIMDILKASRRAARDFLRSTDNIPQALAALLLYGHDVQAAIDEGCPLEHSPEDCLTELEYYPHADDLAGILDFFLGLEILTPQWKSRLKNPAADFFWKPEMRNLAIYLIDRYWLQAISDYDLLCRIKFIVISCLLLAVLGGDLIQTAQLFSKEIENDPDNVEKILDEAYTSPALTDANILGLLLGKKSKTCCWAKNPKPLDKPASASYNTKAVRCRGRNLGV